MKSISTNELIYKMQLQLGDHQTGNAFTEKVCLTLLNFAADKVLSQMPFEEVGDGLFEQDYTITMTSNTGLLPVDTLVVRNARQSSPPSRPVDKIYSMKEFRRRKAKTMLRGTLYRPMAGVDIGSLKFSADAGGYTGNYDIDYIRKANKLALNGVEDENGISWVGPDIDPEWSSQISLVILEQAIEDGRKAQERIVGEKATEELALRIIGRMRT